SRKAATQAGRDNSASSAAARSGGLRPGQASSRSAGTAGWSKRPSVSTAAAWMGCGWRKVRRARKRPCDGRKCCQAEDADRRHAVGDRALGIGSGFLSLAEQVGKDHPGLGAGQLHKLITAGGWHLRDEAVKDFSTQRLLLFGEGIQPPSQRRDFILTVRPA